jgi:hypothetical protein
MIFESSLFSTADLLSAVISASDETNSRAASTHQQEIRTWIQNIRGKSCGR